MNLYPMKLRPVLKDIIWGGTRLANEYGKAAPNQKVAESWELCVHPNGVNIIENGEYAGRTLEELFNLNRSIVSADYRAEKFPVMIKFIDAAQSLAVQVHPDDYYAAINEGGELGKTEMWYIIDCIPGAQIVYGLNADYTGQQLAEHIEAGTFESCLNYVSVSPGDVFFIPSGLIHAIGSGILLAEVQQNSDTTYRMYDYNRPDADGKLRELHVKQALDVCKKTKSEYINNRQQAGTILSKCEYFSVYKGTVRRSNVFGEFGKGYNSVICLGGEGEIIHNGAVYSLKKGDSYFIPAGMGGYTFNRITDVDFILTTLGEG